ncbi:MAG TPA: OsmC family protein [Acidimicrobiia bacterium]|nr:OsmC family protein [Acidimicrobiia bacterium]
MSGAPDVLGADDRPPFFPVANAEEVGFDAPEDRHGLSVRTWVRSLAGMQKEAVVVNGATGSAWRLVSDEGPYLAGHDRAPCPLCTFITGMVSSYANEVAGLASTRGLSLEDLELTLANHYSMEGSALQGTMIGGALTPELDVAMSADAEPSDLDELVRAAVTSSPVNGLLHDEKDSLFTLSWNGEHVPVGAVAGLEGSPLPDPLGRFEEILPADRSVAEDLMVKVTPADQVENVPGGVNTSLQDAQSRTLHVQARCRARDDGVKVVDENLFRPIGSEFRFLSDEAPEAGGKGMAPDAVTYLAAGIGFCFMTQFGRYASITKKPLDGYRIVQDIHFRPGGAGEPGDADPVETHVFLDTPEGEEFARKTLDMGERTCFLHATCRTHLEPRVTIQVK